MALCAPAASDAQVFGAYTADAPYSGDVKAVDGLEQRLGRRIGIVNWYQQWGGDDWIASVQPELVEAVAGSGRAPLLTWEPWDPAAGRRQARFSPRAIARGDFDAYVARFARDLAALDTRVYLRPLHEMNGDWYPWGAAKPATYRAAWRRLHRIFRAQGAANVSWVWNPNAEDLGRRFEAYYPGARYVDVLALDGYNWGATRPRKGGWRTFAEIFRGPMRRLKRLGDQPIWITEVSSAPEGGSKAAWIRGMWKTARRWKRLEALVWFDEDKERDWRAAPSAQVAGAFR